ncbi:hypothetical protein Pmani_016515 [Petrolisthes manimaculis]|uniref:Sulfotransferase n=1 Tax=Petrolisthes manimaculis TaxID=1843537 RepID=A0AAE1PS36_9EUCA|nr:hypothetical protein Pmani_016515 [Petrolisthes manimaculis]
MRRFLVYIFLLIAFLLLSPFYLFSFQIPPFPLLLQSPQPLTMHAMSDVERMMTLLHAQIQQNLGEHMTLCTCVDPSRECVLDGQLRLDPAGKKVWKPWKDDPPGSPCFHYQNRLGIGVVPVRLVSFPCSGNTWFRYLVESATGIFTGSVYNDKYLYKRGYRGELEVPDNGKTLLQKTHAFTYTIKEYLSNFKKRYSNNELFHPAILLIRNPARGIISFYKFTVSESHTGQIDEKHFHSEEFHRLFNIWLAHWESLVLDRLLGSRAPVYVVYYEELVASPLHTLRQVFTFLGIKHLLYYTTPHTPPTTTVLHFPQPLVIPLPVTTPPNH